MAYPLVSVVIPTHRRSQWLADALDSVARQDYSPLQVIVVEDGADDATRQVIATAKLPVEHHVIPHCGRPGVVRNYGIERAAGEFIALLDDDDLWDPPKLTRQVQQLLENPAAPASFTNVRLEFPDGLSGEAGPPPRAAWLSTRSALLCGCFIYPSSMLIRRNSLSAAGGFDDDRFAEAYGLCLRLSRQGDFAHLNEPLVTMRRHGAGNSTASVEGTWTETIDLLNAERSAGGLTLGDRIRLRRVMALGFAYLGRALPRKSNERRRLLWKAFCLSPLASQWWRVQEWRSKRRARSV